MLAVLTLHLHLSGCTSLKEKRSLIKPFMQRLRREFNCSVAEMDLQDVHQQALIGCAMLGNDGAFLQSALENVTRWAEAHWRHGDVWDSKIELVA